MSGHPISYNKGLRPCCHEKLQHDDYFSNHPPTLRNVMMLWHPYHASISKSKENKRKCHGKVKRNVILAESYPTRLPEMSNVKHFDQKSYLLATSGCYFVLILTNIETSVFWPKLIPYQLHTIINISEVIYWLFSGLDKLEIQEDYVTLFLQPRTYFSTICNVM